MKHINVRIKALILTTCISISHLSAFDNPHFYRANFWQSVYEPRFEKEGLLSFDVTVGGGHTDDGRNGDGQKTGILNIYGPANMLKLGENVPCKQPNSDVDSLLTLLARIPTRENFGKFCYRGKFSTAEAAFAVTQNICRGFFVQAHLPLRSLNIHDIHCRDLSPRGRNGVCPNIKNPYWQVFKKMFFNVLKRYHLSIAETKSSGAGDLTLLAGWTRNYEYTEHLDYIDLTIKTGVLFPTGKERNVNRVWSLPTGYDGHYGFPFSLDLGFGAYEWITFGAHGDVTYFFKKNKALRLKTSAEQSGFIKLAKADVSVHPGPLWYGALWLKADHVMRGLSLQAGYSGAHKTRDNLDLCSDCYDLCIINSDEMLQAWTNHTVHLMAEYDFNKENRILGPRVGLIFNLSVAGKRIFSTNMYAASLGLDTTICW